MKTKFLQAKRSGGCLVLIVLGSVGIVQAQPATHYVSQGGTNPTPPYTNWVTAATNIQDAVNVAVPGDSIMVTNGLYPGGVTVTNPLALFSANGPQVTVINGGGTNQCVSLADGANLTGFTLTNGYNSGYGGGVYCQSSNAVLSNCVLAGNSANVYDWDIKGGIYGGTGGGSYGGTLNNCILKGNSANIYTGIGLGILYGPGGGAYGSILNHCTLTGNLAGEGGGADNCTLNNCTLTGNSAIGNGGGANDCTLNNCTLTDNSASGGGGAAGGSLNNCTLTDNSASEGGGAYACMLNNCVLTRNSGYWGGGAASGYSQPCTLNNCTLTGNTAVYGGGANSCTLNNCTVYFNSDPFDGGNCDPSCTLSFCCTTPMPTSGVGNISADPQLASAAYLSPYSPCIGAGGAAYASGTDIEGEAWANPPSIGCDEYHAGTVMGSLSVAIADDYTTAATGFPVHLTAFIEGRTDLSVWNFGDGDVSVNEPYTPHAWTAPGNYLVSLWAFNDSYPEGVSATVTVHVVDDVCYVAASSGNPVAPYTSWATAATNIQDAVDVAPPSATIFVTNGFYAPVAVNTPLILQSVNGPGVTLIDGGGVTNCVYLTNNAMLVGFTLTNGLAGRGGGIYCESSAVLSNCLLSGNSAILSAGPGQGGGAYGGTLNNCILTGNQADAPFSHNGGDHGGFGGGAYGSILNNCNLSGNSAGYGGGAYDCTLNKCTLTGNSANSRNAVPTLSSIGGGAYGGTLNNCILTGNSANRFYFETDVGGSGGGSWGATLNNCILSGNSAGDGGGAEFCTINNSVVSENTGGGADSSKVNNCIVYFNTASNGGNYDSYSTLNYCCTTPMPTNGIYNITNAPLFVDYSNGNLRLQPNSPCINSGNNAYVVGSTDLDGNPRIVGGTVDIGAYEYQTPMSMISYAWLQQYCLPINTNTDTADLDGSGFELYQDWVAGLNPTNALSVLQMLAPSATNSPLGLVVSWQSVSNITYFLQRSINLAAQPAFITIQSNIVGQAGATSYTDTNAVGSGQLFYRVGVGN